MHKDKAWGNNIKLMNLARKTYLKLNDETRPSAKGNVEIEGPKGELGFHHHGFQRRVSFLG